LAEQPRREFSPAIPTTGTSHAPAPANAKFAEIRRPPGSIHTHFNQERTLISRQIFKDRRTGALTAWRPLCAA
jgi:hypothetical protein